MEKSYTNQLGNQQWGKLIIHDPYRQANVDARKAADAEQRQIHIDELKKAVGVTP